MREAEANEFLRMRIGQRSEQRAAHDGVDRCCGTDAERQRQHSGDGEARGAAKLAESVAKIGQRAGHAAVSFRLRSCGYSDCS